MPWAKDITYSRDATVTAVREYYHFLTKLYLKESHIIEPPEGGWPQITQENLGHLGKTDEVIDLLRHLPYIRVDDNEEPPQLAPGTTFADWTELATSQAKSDDIRLSTEGDEYETVPSHVVGLAQEARWAFNFNIDTQAGIIYWLKCPGKVSENPTFEGILDPPGELGTEEEQWRGDGEPWAIPDLFKQLQHEFEQLNFVPFSQKTVDDDYSKHSGEANDPSKEAMREVYREHGWPNLEKYRKEDCLKALRVMLKEKYPDVLIGEEDD